ncbi:TonB-dependent receptor [Gemmatimonadetes bacterium T265]|nr:TonB-dependent receptor [Gemmatimonadetes bacterium T265]
MRRGTRAIVRGRVVAFGGAAGIVLASAAARAQATAPPTAPDSAARDSSRRVARLAPTVVVAGRLAPAAATAGAASAAARVDWAEFGAPGAALPAVGGPAPATALLSRLPGVASFDDQGTRAQPTLDVRGFTLSPVVGVGQGVSVFLDGVRVNEADAQQVNFDLLPAEAVRDAALVRGPSALYGKNTLGGALVLATRRGGDGGPGLDVAVDGGAFGQRGVQLTASGARGAGAAEAGPSGAGATVDGYVLARAGGEDGWRDATAARRRLVFGTAGRRTAAGDVALSVLLARDSLGQAGSLPESWLAAGERRANYTPGDWYAPRTVHVALRGRRRLGDPSAAAGEVRGTLFVRDTRSGQFNVNADAPSTLARVRAASAGGTVEGERRTTLLGMPFVATAGGEFSRDAVRYRVYERASGPADDAQPDGACAPAASGADAECEDATANALNAAAFAQGVLAPARRVSLVASVRGDWVRVPFVDRFTPANSGTSAFRQLSPRVGVTATPGAAWRAYASAGTGFRAPAAVELACADPASPCPLPFSLGDDPPLRPVRVRNVEAGADWTPRLGVVLTASAFRADVRDEILLVASGRTAGYFTNFPRTRRAGLELAGRAGPADGLSAFASWALVRATYEAAGLLASARATPDSVRPGDRLPLSPDRRATAGVRAAGRAAGWSLGAELSGSAVGVQRLRGGEGGTAAAPGGDLLPGYALAALRLSARRGRVEATASVSNLLDRRYVTFGTWAPNALAPDRTGLPGGERVERFVTPGYPRGVGVGVRVER